MTSSIRTADVESLIPPQASLRSKCMNFSSRLSTRNIVIAAIGVCSMVAVISVVSLFFQNDKNPFQAQMDHNRKKTLKNKCLAACSYMPPGFVTALGECIQACIT